MKLKLLYLLLSLFILVGCDGETIYKQVIHTRAKLADLNRYSKTVDGSIRIDYYENDVQSDKTLVFIHGYGDDKDTWLEVAMALRNRYHMILVDLPGYGESIKDIHLEYSLDNQSTWLKHFLNTFDNRDTILIGNSMGGAVAVKYASQYTVSKLILISALGVSETPSYFDLLPLQTKASYHNNICSVQKLDELYALLMQNVPYLPYSVKEYLASKRCADENLLKKEGIGHVYDGETFNFLHRQADEASRIDVPTLILWGKNDKVLDVHNADLFHSLINNSRVIKYNNVGHVPMREKPAQVAFDISRFLSH